jgi:hypothetical protein
MWLRKTFTMPSVARQMTAIEQARTIKKMHESLRVGLSLRAWTPRGSLLSGYTRRDPRISRC